jgi:hypothetical protein
VALNPTGGAIAGVVDEPSLARFGAATRSGTCLILHEPPGADPHAGWCGEGGLKARPYPIRSHVASICACVLRYCALDLGHTESQCHDF